MWIFDGLCLRFTQTHHRRTSPCGTAQHSAECPCRRPSAPGRGGPMGRSGGPCGSTFLVGADLGSGVGPPAPLPLPTAPPPKWGEIVFLLGLLTYLPTPGRQAQEFPMAPCAGGHFLPTFFVSCGVCCVVSCVVLCCVVCRVSCCGVLCCVVLLALGPCSGGGKSKQNSVRRKSLMTLLQRCGSC